MFEAEYCGIWSTNLSEDYPKLLKYVKKYGDVVPSRIGETTELLNLRLELTNPEYCIVDRAGMSHDFMMEEITQILAGYYDHDRLYAIVPRAAELITPATAYGPRTWRQLRSVCYELDESPTSRRAVVYIGRPSDLHDTTDTSNTAGEMPCTMTWQFHLRDKRLHMTVNMRSWDLVWGLSYDVPSFVAVQMAVANHLGVKIGKYVHNAGSGHIYDRHYDIEVRPGTKKLDISHLLKGDIAETQEFAYNLMK